MPTRVGFLQLATDHHVAPIGGVQSCGPCGIFSKQRGTDPLRIERLMESVGGFEARGIRIS